MERIIGYTDAIREATEQEMVRDPSVIIFGIGVDDMRGLLGTTKGLVEKFGSERVFDTPLSEDGLSGVAVGVALAGLRPIHTHVRMDFLTLAMNQIINVAAKARYMSGGKVSVPLVIRTLIGDGWGAQHSQGLHSFFMHIPGLKVVAPSSAYDAKGCLIQSIRDDNPVIFVEHFKLYSQKGHVPEEPYTIPFGKAKILKAGEDITLVGFSYMVSECLRAAEYLADASISVEVIDPVSLLPLDIDTIVDSVKKTKRLLVADSAWTACGASAEIIAGVAERLGNTPLRFARVGFAPVPSPTTTALETLFYPNAETVASKAYSLSHGDDALWAPKKALDNESSETAERV